MEFLYFVSFFNQGKGFFRQSKKTTIISINESIKFVQCVVYDNKSYQKDVNWPIKSLWTQLLQRYKQLINNLLTT